MLEDHKEEGDIKRVGVRKSSEMANGAPQLLNFLNLNFLDKGGNLISSTPPASKSPAPNMDLGAQDQQKNQKSEGLQLDLRNLELDLRFRGGLGLSPIGLENFRGGLSPSPPLNLKSNSKTLKSTSKMPKSCML